MREVLEILPAYLVLAALIILVVAIFVGIPMILASEFPR